MSGEGNIDTTALIWQFASGKLSEAGKLKHGVDITTQNSQIEGELVQLAIWDIDHHIGNRTNVRSGAQAAIPVYDGTWPPSLEALDECHNRSEQYAGNAPVFMVCNTIDSELPCPHVWGRVFAKRVEAPHGFVSAHIHNNVVQAFTLLASNAASHVTAFKR